MHIMVHLVVLGGMIQNMLFHHSFNQPIAEIQLSQEQSVVVKPRNPDWLHPIEEAYPWIAYIKIRRRKQSKKNTTRTA